MTQTYEEHLVWLDELLSTAKVIDYDYYGFKSMEWHKCRMTTTRGTIHACNIFNARMWNSVFIGPMRFPPAADFRDECLPWKYV